MSEQPTPRDTIAKSLLLMTILNEEFLAGPAADVILDALATAGYTICIVGGWRDAVGNLHSDKPPFEGSECVFVPVVSEAPQ